MFKAKSQLVATIPNGATDSGVATVPFNGTLVGLHLPAGMTGTTLKFKASKDENATATLVKKADGTGDYSITIGASAAYHPVDPSIFYGAQFLTVVSGSAEGAARNITLVFGTI